MVICVCVCVIDEPVRKKREEMEIMMEMEADGDKNADRPQVKAPPCKKIKLPKANCAVSSSHQNMLFLAGQKCCNQNTFFFLLP